MDGEKGAKYVEDPGGWKTNKEGNIDPFGNEANRAAVEEMKYKEGEYKKELKEVLSELVSKGEKPVYEIDAEGNLVPNDAAKKAEEEAKKRTGLDKKAA